MNCVNCNCGKEIQTDFPSIFDTVDTPDLIEAILGGTFLSVQCSDCGALVKPELPVRIIDGTHGIDFLFRPDQERRKYLAGMLDLPEADRVVFGYPELAEKVLIYSRDLDDRVLEVIKYFYLKKAGADKDLTIYLDGMDTEHLRFQIHGLRLDEIGIANIGRTFYENTEKNLEDIVGEEDIEEIIAAPFVSIKKVYLGEDE